MQNNPVPVPYVEIKMRHVNEQNGINYFISGVIEVALQNNLKSSDRAKWGKCILGQQN